MKVEIELITTEDPLVWRGWKVSHDGKYADGLGYDEMLGLVAAITMPQERPTLQWLKTPDQHKAYKEHLDMMNTKPTPQ
jgi:hypothetical protein